jgi:hypothetical protein
MGLLDWFKKESEADILSVTSGMPLNAKELNDNVDQVTVADVDKIDDLHVSEEQTLHDETDPDIPEHIFVEYEKPKISHSMEPNEASVPVNNLQSLYSFLEQNFEKKGYEDALMNPDTSFRDEHIRFIQNELNLMLSKVNIHYSGYMRTIEFHIETRKRSGMMETVDELLTQKATIQDEMKVVSIIEEDAKKCNGLTENLFVSYKKGFKNGFAAITYNTVLNKRI